MAILWCGGEDIDFQVGGSAQADTTAGRFRTTYNARCGLTSALGVYLQSEPFAGGAVTSAWLTFWGWDNRTATANALFCGLVDSATVASGLWVGSGATASKLAILTYDGVTKTVLATEAGNSLSTVQIHRFDMQMVSYGATSTINVYVDGALVVTFSGDCTVAGVTNVDAVGLAARAAASNYCAISEIIVADEDTRGFPGLATLALTSDGTTTDWTGVYSTINQVGFSDTTPNYTNTNDLLQEFNVTDLPSGTFAVRAVKLCMRAAKAAGTPTQIALGYNEGGTVTVEGDIALTTAYATYEQLDNTNPRTAAAWDPSIMNALQITAKSRA